MVRCTGQPCIVGRTDTHQAMGRAAALHIEARHAPPTPHRQSAETIGLGSIQQILKILSSAGTSTTANLRAAMQATMRNTIAALRTAFSLGSNNQELGCIVLRKYSTITFKSQTSRSYETPIWLRPGAAQHANNRHTDQQGSTGAAGEQRHPYGELV